MAIVYYVFVSRSIQKSLDCIPLPWRQRIREAIDGLKTDPYVGIKMNGEMKDRRKLKIWPYRVIYKIFSAEGAVKIFEVEHRGHMSYK